MHSRLVISTLAVLALAATGCGAEDGVPTSAEPGTSPSSPTVSVEATPSPLASETASNSPSSSALPSPTTLTDRLLATTQVPGLNARWVWQDGETGPATDQPFGLCAKFDFASIGASEVIERSYFPPVDTDDSAGEQVVEFPDASTAARAASVLKTWHRTCKGQVEGAGVKVGPITPVSVDRGAGYWYLVSYREGLDEGRFHAFGVVTSGTRIAVMSIDNGGQDYNYPAGREPMVAMVRAAAQRLG